MSKVDGVIFRLPAHSFFNTVPSYIYTVSSVVTENIDLFFIEVDFLDLQKVIHRTCYYLRLQTYQSPLLHSFWKDVDWIFCHASCHVQNNSNRFQARWVHHCSVISFILWRTRLIKTTFQEFSAHPVGKINGSLTGLTSIKVIESTHHSCVILKEVFILAGARLHQSDLCYRIQ